MLCAGAGATLTGSLIAAQSGNESALAGPAEKAPAEKPAANPPPAKEEAGERPFRVDKEITSVIWSPDGKLFAGPDTRAGRLKVWDAQTGKEFVAHDKILEGGVFLGFTPDSKNLVLFARSAPTKNDMIRFWKVDDGKPVKTIRFESEATVPRVAFSPDGRQLAVLSGDSGAVRLWDVRTGKVVREIRHAEPLANALSYSRDGKLLVVGGGDKNKGLRLFDVQSGKIIWQTLTTGMVWGIAFSPDGKMIAAAQDDSRIVFIDTATGKVVKLFSDACHHNHQPTFSRDGRSLLCTGMSLKGGKPVAEVRLWDVPSGKLLRTWSDNRNSAAFSPDGKTVFVLGKDGAIESFPLGGSAIPQIGKPAGGEARSTRLVNQLLAGKKSDEQVIEAVFLATLGRFPSEIEGKTVSALLANKKDRREAIEDLIVALRGSKEYLQHLDSLNRSDPRKK
jgi:WD40 repeat protein